jgi:hypothetical protein
MYALKDRKLLSRAKGAIELEMNFVYNPVRVFFSSLEVQLANFFKFNYFFILS